MSTWLLVLAVVVTILILSAALRLILGGMVAQRELEVVERESVTVETPTNRCAYADCTDEPVASIAEYDFCRTHFEALMGRVKA